MPPSTHEKATILRCVGIALVIAFALGAVWAIDKATHLEVRDGYLLVGILELSIAAGVLGCIFMAHANNIIRQLLSTQDQSHSDPNELVKLLVIFALGSGVIYIIAMVADRLTQHH